MQDKQTLEQVPNEKSRRIAVLETHNKDLKENKNGIRAQKIQEPVNQLQNQTTTHTDKSHIMLLGDSNCRDIQPQLMRWLKQDVEKVDVD